MARAADPLVGDGLLVVDKPAGWTSHDVVGRIRRIAGTRKVGHAGTLDPMATGVLVVGVNRGTRLLTFLVGCDKRYIATIRLGQATVTDDAEGEITTAADPSGLVPKRIDAAVATLTGDIDQVPSSVSAIKVDGVRSYARVRSGDEVALAARPVHVAAFEVLRCTPVDTPRGPALDLDVAVEVSSGTYVRALARDLGRALGVGGHLVALRRTRVGAFAESMAATPDALAQTRHTAAPGTSGLPLLSLAEAARAALPVRELDAAEAEDVGHGRAVPSAVPGRGQPVAALGPDGDLVAVLDESRAVARSRAVFCAA